MTRIVLLGDSHIGPLTLAARRRSDELEALGVAVEKSSIGPHRELLEPFFTLDETRVRFHLAEFTEGISVLDPPPADTVLALSLGFHAPFFFLRVFKRFAPIGTQKDEPWIVSRAAMKAVIRERHAHQEALILALRDRLGSRIVVVEPPKLFAHSTHLRNQNHALCRAVDDAVRENTRRFLEANRIALVALPGHMVGADGLMRPRYAHENRNDPHHGGQAFADEMLDRLLAEIGHAPAAPADAPAERTPAP